MKAIFRGLSVSMIALVAAGCSTPNPTALDKPGDVPPAFTAPAADKQAPIWPEANWWVNFKADELPALRRSRPEGKSGSGPAAARVLQAEAKDGVAFSALLPTVNLQGGATAHTVGTTHSSGSAGVSRNFNSFTAGLAASYQADLGA